MPDFYFNIRTKNLGEGAGDDGGFYSTRWAWPPIYAGMVTADDKDAAKKIIDDEFGRKFPQRVLKKNMDSNEFILMMHKVSDDDKRTRGLFDVRKCVTCGGGFRVIDLYNDCHEKYKGQEFCGITCKEKFQEDHSSVMFSRSFSGKTPAVVYQIKNRNTGMVYVGQTTQPFTLRWYQHFYHGGGCKFHQAVKASQITDWDFSILEVVNFDEKKDKDQKDFHFLLEREAFWIKARDSVAAGYNSAGARSIDDSQYELLTESKEGTEI
jgi:hypothetical protein